MHDTSFPEGWHEWVAAAKAKPVYGAKSFLKYADKKVSIFTIFLTVIKKKIFKATKENLKILDYRKRKIIIFY